MTKHNPSSAAAMGSSPHSFEEYPHQATPSTVITAFSSDTGGNTTGPRVPKVNIQVAEPEDEEYYDRYDVVAGKKPSTSNANDPFVQGPASNAAARQLSPVADTFVPGHATHAAPIPANVASRRSAGSVQTVLQGGRAPNGLTHGRVSSLVATSTPDTASYSVAAQNPIGVIGERANDVEGNLVANFNKAMRLNVAPVVPFQPILFREAQKYEGTFTTDEVNTRAMLITNINVDTSFATIATVFNVATFSSLKGINAADLTTMGTVSVDFADLRDAVHAYQTVQQLYPQWHLVRLAPRAYARVIRGPNINVDKISDYDGQIKMSVAFNGRDNRILGEPVIASLVHALTTFGDIKAFHTSPYNPDTQANVRHIRVEFLDTRSAYTAWNSLDHAQIGDVVILPFPYEPDVVIDPVRPLQPSATGRSVVPVGDPALAYYDQYNMIGRDHHGARYNRDIAANHNQVEIGRIQRGLDVRTTIMLRNIPNKVDQSMLKDILDETSHGCYDFMYLRIDFANNCNVGYAFINFVDALAIVPFAMARSGQRWNRFNSDKVAEISYATIQGKDCLVQKFRNSSVMLEHPSYRPKLYIAGNIPGAGEEDAFPKPDNPSKMRRSVENAEHVGLFRGKIPVNPFPIDDARSLQPKKLLIVVDTRAPNDPLQRATSGLFAPRQGQVYREEQRRRRSQFDRGTPGAEFEALAQGLMDPALVPYHHNGASIIGGGINGRGMQGGGIPGGGIPGGGIHGGGIQGGGIHGGGIHGGGIQGGGIPRGNIRHGSIHGGSIRGGCNDDDSMYGSSTRGGGIQGGGIRGGGNDDDNDSMYDSSICDNNTHGGNTRSGRVFGGEATVARGQGNINLRNAPALGEAGPSNWQRQ